MVCGHKKKKESLNFTLMESRGQVLQKETYSSKWDHKTYKRRRRSHCNGRDLEKDVLVLSMKGLLWDNESREYRQDL